MSEHITTTPVNASPMAHDPECVLDPGESAEARVHDLGYKRYQGARRPQATRYRTIARKLVSTAWRSFWRMKLWIILAVLIAFVMGLIMFLSEGVSQLMRDGEKLPLSDALLPMSYRFFQISAFALSMTVIASTVAADLRTGAFEFYFARPVRAVDYVLGKVWGAFLVVGCVLFLGPLVLAFLRVGLADVDHITGTLSLVPKAALVGLLATLVYTLVPLAFSSISSRARHTVPAWAAFYFLTSVLIPVISRETGMTSLEALDIPRSIHTLAYGVFDAVPITDSTRSTAGMAAAGLLAYSALGLSFLYWRVSQAERRGMGGA